MEALADPGRPARRHPLWGDYRGAGLTYGRTEICAKNEPASKLPSGARTEALGSLRWGSSSRSPFGPVAHLPVAHMRI